MSQVSERFFVELWGQWPNWSESSRTGAEVSTRPACRQRSIAGCGRFPGRGRSDFRGIRKAISGAEPRGSMAVPRMAANVKGFRMPARRRREGVHGGRRPKSLEGGNRGGSSHRRWCRSMGNSPPLLDLICGLRTGRGLSDQLGAGFGRCGWDWCGDLVFGAAGFVGRRWRRGSLSAKRGRCR
jgi:hypothetical protein